MLEAVAYARPPYRAVIQLAVAGVIERKGQTLYVCDHERLTELAEGGAALMLAAR